ncbi:alpha-L-iduronidase-like isoform X2 [Dreissena polymorpha]|uniref:Alpha-L-iduronidase n=3 Tax=Dreissena polymorpha TaxID=45954 RepID=A0A9D4BTH8_DREPO|nr:alpha-L-iduronidase-like isoform X2 [Dreissena polymorpha]XP_052248988.1 alpha-L-iduronidase-like isoform X2 [Dreissena polymorpha]XP_052248989.1 alpha-L-iduronidase-like isoform X2 [Dreissena polymorpha]XP_052248990.1 alpha-L-iduronidase-like isoform X2 [Dreissena polymorpha]XP_052248991.1 alpha-L-iduronidase-like isoform X2 [Dreissena polymorpha]XP_052248992.1 alpha-L-iduronidase-like isoform X2 [Dreissena polymorpha]KAH3708034.1 hypothetical protein DPMN_067473 [Dreissena polymorpha]
MRILMVVSLCLKVINNLVAGVQIHVRTSEAVGPLRHFWQSTGFCPPLPHMDAAAFDLSHDMQYNIAMIGSMPRSGIEQVRIHWLLDLITVTSLPPFKPPIYNFTSLDSLIDLLYANGMRPGFELMGNPSGLFKDFEDKTSLMMWKDLVTQTAQRYINQYGVGWVSQWNFESWNEPDCRDFDNVNMTVQGFLNYYDACSEGLKAASLDLKLGGPGDGCHGTLYSDALLQHIVNGTNYFTGETGIRLDFLSYHKKGDGSSYKILEDEISLMDSISNRFPTLADKPFFNDEADPLVGWSQDEEWRADSTYAAIVAKVINQHQKAFISNPQPRIHNYQLLSNDNAFLSWFPHQYTQRTLLARFQMNNTSPPHTHFFQKPVYNVMALLSMLGEIEVQSKITYTNGEDLNTPLGVLASTHTPVTNHTADSWQTTVLMYMSNDTGPQTDKAYVYLSMDIEPPSWASQELHMVGWWLDNTLGNSYKLWDRAGRPPYPTLELQHQMRTISNSPPIFNQPVQPGNQFIGKFFIKEPAVVVVHVCSKPDAPPDQPNNVNILNITSGQILLTWSDKCLNSRCILNYEVAYSVEDTNYTTIDPGYGLAYSTSFVYQPTTLQGVAPDNQVIGFYKVRALDYFGQYSEYSLPQQYPSSGKVKLGYHGNHCQGL